MVGATDPCADPITPRAAASILEHMSEAFVSVDANWRFTYVNAQAEFIYKKAREHLLGNSLWQMYPTALGTEFEREYRRVMAERVEGRVQAPFPQLEGWFDVKVYPLDNGGLAFYFSDITQRRCAERHLACVRKLQELIFAGMPLNSLLAVLAGTMESISVQPVLACILVMDADNAHLLHGAAPSLPDAFSQAIGSIAAGPEMAPYAAAAYAKRTVVIEDIATHPSASFRELARAHGLRAAWATPIVSPQGVVLGTFSLYYRDTVRPAPAEEESASILANLAALMISRKRLQGTPADHALPQQITGADHLELLMEHS
jgi:GAF domain-containing protein